MQARYIFLQQITDYFHIYIFKTLTDMEKCVKGIFKKTRWMFGKHMPMGVYKELKCFLN